ncbi:glycine-rich protein 3-like [Cimex lectularius]|uniref:Uncharacterized protein n=1 Tax=Cimex lectularius TaxID=79782 RepID=A0A8I6SLK8_CIMLE|nr:glycine-rich protein 3-like [Cimex lectularius]
MNYEIALILCFVSSVFCVFSKEQTQDLDAQETLGWMLLPHGPFAQHRIKKNLQSLSLLGYSLGHYGFRPLGLGHFGPWHYGVGGNFGMEYDGYGHFGGYGSIGQGYRYLPKFGHPYGYYGGDYGYKY